MGEAGLFSDKENISKGMDHMDIDFSEEDSIEAPEDLIEYDDDDVIDSVAAVKELGADFLKKLCKEASASFFEEYGLISHQINSYNDFIHNGIQNVFDSIGEIIVDPGYDPSMKGENEWRFASVKFGHVTLERPRFWTGENFSENGKEFLDLYPKHARLQNMSYSSRMKVQVCIQMYTKRMVKSDKSKSGDREDEYCERDIIFEDSRDFIIGRIPVMVKSALCWMSRIDQIDCDFDHGGYFLVKGSEKVFVAQEQICLKRLWLANRPEWMVAYRPVIKTKRVYIKIKDIHNNKSQPKIAGGEKFLNVWFSVMEIPIWILFFALGVSSDREIVSLIEADMHNLNVANIINASIRQADKKCSDFRKPGRAFTFVEDAIKTSRSPLKTSVNERISESLFSNLDSFKKKARFLGYMVKCLLEGYTGKRKVDNRDDFRNKRMDLASELLSRELRVHLKHAERHMVKKMQRDLYGDRSLHSIDYYLDSSIVTNGLARAFSTGSWCHPYKKMEKISGVVANLRRTNPLQTMADMRKTRQQVLYTAKAGDARYPHPSHWGRVCFLSTPDGENCGLVKNLASMGIVSTKIDEPLFRIFEECGMEDIVEDTSTSLTGKAKVFMDGDWIGTCRDSAAFVATLRSKRRKTELSNQVEIKRDNKHKEVRIYCDAGRILRPLLLVNKLHRLKEMKGQNCSFRCLLENGIIELIGSEEEEDCNTAWGISYLIKKNHGIEYTHCELDMSFVLALSCGIIPFANHDHAKRVLFQSQKHSQQAIGFSTTNPNIRVDTALHQLYYPQKPLFRTMLSDCLKGKPEFHNGQCAIVAVNVHLGYNQEDSLVMNRASIERGMFRSEHVRTYKSDVSNSEASTRKKQRFEDSVCFGKIQSKFGRVESLDDDGLPYIGANMQSGDIIIGRYAESGADRSVKLKHTEKGMVQKVVLSANDDGKNFAQVSLRQVRWPSLGDKFSSMHGQKGVLGFLESQENLPFTKEGIVPDIVINPHAFPSRQTPGQLLEAALGKGFALGGSEKYATPFSTLSVEAISDQLHRGGFVRWGNERVYNGRTGEMVGTLVFMGPTFYQRLVHMAEDKAKFRIKGPVHPLTRQPVADRKRFGGVKFGEMERDCLISHGASANLHERLFALSDPSQMHVCRKCKHMSNVVQRSSGQSKVRGPFCRVCKSVEDIVKVDVPYGAKLLVQELFSMGISLKFETKLC